jgi:hypothetical protein
MYLRGMGWDGMLRNGFKCSGRGVEHGDEPSASIKGGEFLD